MNVLLRYPNEFIEDPKMW